MTPSQELCLLRDCELVITIIILILLLKARRQLQRVGKRVPEENLDDSF